MLTRELWERLDRIDGLLIHEPLRKYAESEFGDYLEQLFARLAQTLDIPKLEERLQAQFARSVRRHLERLDRIAPSDLVEDAPEDTLNRIKEYIADARSLLDATEQLMPIIDAMEVGLRLELVVERSCTRPLQMVRRPHPVVNALEQELKPKLALLSEQQQATLWAKVTRELREPLDGRDQLEESVKIPLDGTIVGASFFNIEAPDEIVEKLAKYLADLRPRLLWAAIMSGQTSFPMPPVAVAQCLSWQESATDISPEEARVLTSISRLLFVATRRCSKELPALAHILTLKPDGRVASGPSSDRAEELIPGDAESALRAGVHEARELLSATSKLFAGASERELGLLFRYKLSREVNLEAALGEFQDLNELAIQRRLAAFLIEHGLHVRGTKLGNAESDLVTDAVDPFVIEVKLFRKQPTPAALLDAISQLQVYMDKAPYASRGALFVVNLSRRPIRTPKEYLRGRFGVISMNLSTQSPSKTKDCLVVEPSESGKQLANILKVQC